MRYALLTLFFCSTALAQSPHKQEADLDGDGQKEQVVLDKDGLRIGVALFKITYPAADVWDEADLAIVDFDKKDPAKEVHVSYPVRAGDEDPGDIDHLFAYRGGVVKELLRLEHLNMRFPGDRTVRSHDVDLKPCWDGKKKSVPEFELRYGWDRAKKKLVRKSKKRTGTASCENLSACPFVYVVNGDGEVLAGEILRDLRGAVMANLQSLPIALPPGKNRLRIRLREEKPEITHLDHIYVTVGGRIIEPTACAGNAPPAYCAADGHPALLHLGDVLGLEFPIAEPGEVLLWASGYYVPLP